MKPTTSRPYHALFGATLAGLIAALLLLTPSQPVRAAERVLVNDPLNGATTGTFIGKGGEFVTGGGYRSSGATIVFDAGQHITNGYFEATMRGFSVPASGTAKSHPLSCWETKNSYSQSLDPASYWNWRIGSNYEVFKVLATYQSHEPLPDDPSPREEARVGSPGMVNDGKPHRYRVEWNNGVISFSIDGTHLKTFTLKRLAVRYCTIGVDRWYRSANPAPIISDVTIVTRTDGPGATATPTTTVAPPSPTPTPPSGEVAVTGLVVNDSANAAAWSVRANLQTGNASYGDRPRTVFTSLPPALVGATWIRSANESKWASNDPLASFTISRAADVYLALDNRVSPPAWLAGWSDTGEDLANSSASFSLYRRRLPAGPVLLGPLGAGGADRSMYVVIVR